MRHWNLILLILASTAMSVVAWADPRGGGGLPACEDNLKACAMDLGTCVEDLAACETTQVVLPGDGAGNGAPLEYEVCADGLTVADLNTGLLWEQKVAGGSFTCDLVDLHLLDSKCNWTDANGAWIDAVNAEGDTGYAGFADWRVPNVKELQSIVDYGRVRPAIDPAFTWGRSSGHFFWSATSVAFSFPGNAWFVFFDDGRVFFDGKNLDLRVRAVRSGPCSTP
jgi:hypothetical protein